MGRVYHTHHKQGVHFFPFLKARVKSIIFFGLLNLIILVGTVNVAKKSSDGIGDFLLCKSTYSLPKNLGPLKYIEFMVPLQCGLGAPGIQ